ncbi:hypothetical protein S245_063977, partial [Arachis hypogaea]
DPSTFKDRIGTQLMNLRCPTMSDYRWYKDVFMSKVIIRDDAHAPFWKERFVAALPKLFSEKVLQKLQIQFGTQIPYESLTFGQLHNIIVQTGIEICTDTKIQQKIKQESITGKRELGTFCYQYGITPETAPRKPKSSNKCTTEQKINKIENKEIKHALTAILINSESEEESIYEDSSETEDYFIQQLDLMTEEESSEGNSGKEEQNNCLGIGLCNCRNCEKTVNVLTREQTSTLVKIIDRLEDTPLRDDFIKQLAELVKKEEESKQEIRPTEIKEIYDRFKNPQEKVSLNSLKEEIKKLKKEVLELKQQNINMDYRLLKIEGENIIKIQEQTLQNNDKKPEEISNITIPENYINLGTENYINVLTLLVRQKWFTTITLIVGEEKFDFIAMVDSGADVNCIQEGLIPTKYYEKTTERVLMAENDTMTIDYKLSKAKICKNRVCFATTFFLARNISHQVILGNPFTLLLYPFNVDIDGITCTRIPNHPVHFEFLTRPKQHELN